MKLIKAKSYEGLFFLCIIGSILVNAIFYIFNIFFIFNSINYISVTISGFLQLGIGLVLGQYIYKNNRNLLSEERQVGKKYAIITIIGILVLLVIFLCPDIIMMLYTYVLVTFYNIFGLNHLFSIYDFGCILICLASVFLRKVQ